MSEDDRNKGSSGAVRGGVLEELPLDRLTDAGQDLLEAVVSRAVGSLTGRVTDLAGKLTSGGGSGAGWVRRWLV
ncbi:hypothetical protein BJF85_12095 [Saccharomonospora sp. CUA-673]|uniref:hypothetical protein n=1 Tax=Saccharomonospora sp. CUA-673 TaxID=1904969 RepID=UPI000962F69A|nr:hypothetical protein [Saccharomonospora sp. CUA-673]OLT48548.1 hypothetical protein BJF85_12095 [Saccharomonospora sp. CUA-673]